MIVHDTLLRMPTHPFSFLDSLTAILVSRFLLELQEADHWAGIRIGTDSLDPSGPSRHLYSGSPSTFISSLGAFINPDLTASCDDEAELSPEVPFEAEDGGIEQSP